MINAVIVGYGTVGKATAKAFHIEKYYSRSEKNISLEDIAKLDYIFICLPTPTKEGKCDTKAIEAFISDIQAIVVENEYKQPVYIIRSTVYPGFNIHLQKRFGIRQFVSNPEFLSEDTAFEDAQRPDFVVIGSSSQEASAKVVALYKGRFKYCDYVITDPTTAELIKYTLNTFFATKVIFGNVIFDYAQSIGANYETIKGVLEHHKWGSINHFRPWYKGKRGLHGKCLPKDLLAFTVLTNAPFFQGVIKQDMLVRQEENAN